MSRDYDESAGPFSHDAEVAVLTGLMLFNEELANVQDWLAADDFHSKDHEVIYGAIVDLSAAGKPADGVTVGEWAQAQGGEDGRRLNQLAVQLASFGYTRANVVSYAEIIVEHSRMRRLIDTCQRALKAAQGGRGHSAEQLASHLANQMADIALVRAVGLRPYREVMKRFAEQLTDRHVNGTKVGLPTPWADINKAIGGLCDGQVIVLAARSNMGKSLMGFQQARFTGLRGDQVAVFSMEMVDTDVAARDIAAIGEIPLQWIIGQDNDTTASDADVYWSKTVEAIRSMKEADIVLDDDPQLSAPQVVARAKRAHARRPLRLVVVDHLHEMSLPGKQDEALERGQALRDLKGLAKYLKCPVLVLAQLNRAGAKGERPKVTDIRGSGGIEEVADVILFVHRPEVYKADDSPGVVEVIVGKGRNIKTGTVVRLRNRYQYQRADDMDGVADSLADLEPPPPRVELAPPIGRQPRGSRSGRGRPVIGVSDED